METDDRQKRIDLHFGILQRDNDQDVSDLSREELTEKTVILQKKLFERTNEQILQDMICKGLQECDALKKTIFDSNDTDSAARIIELLERKQAVCAKLVTKHQEILKMQDYLMDSKIKLVKKTEMRRDAMESMHTKEELDKKRSEQHHEELEEQAKDKRQMSQILGGVLHRLVGGSGLNWARDPALLALAVSTGQPLEQQLAAIDP